MSSSHARSVVKRVLRNYVVPHRLEGRPLLLAGYCIVLALLAAALIYQVNRRSTLWPVVITVTAMVGRLVIMFRDERRTDASEPSAP